VQVNLFAGGWEWAVFWTYKGYLYGLSFEEMPTTQDVITKMAEWVQEMIKEEEEEDERVRDRESSRYN
jgi:hypothetical protein